ncbi:hypothetical protein MNVI_07450 [Mycobacterium noviomagense]|uniref:Uncharacterized protein n=1 Tax=Mycobacterium noviomagense TaxID=459858 RepID=A0A7I7PA15_9MYCO|nr:hypothetical protein MNVI_07450 [Mycobacterium noviomagense]
MGLDGLAQQGKRDFTDLSRAHRRRGAGCIMRFAQVRVAPADPPKTAPFTRLAINPYMFPPGCINGNETRVFRSPARCLLCRTPSHRRRD